eukprot:1406273-Karenia_brevis.AAC.1
MKNNITLKCPSCWEVVHRTCAQNASWRALEFWCNECHEEQRGRMKCKICKWPVVGLQCLICPKCGSE